MQKIEIDIQKAIEISENHSKNSNEMVEYSKIYQNTSENIRAYTPFLVGNYQTALLPTASGDHQLEAMLDEIMDITCYDTNRLARYFTELKFSAIKNLTKNEFIRFMYEDMLNQEIFEFLKNNLDNDIAIFWKELFNHCDIRSIRNNLFRKMGIYDSNGNVINNTEFSRYCVENFTRYLDDSNYKVVQDRLQKAKIEYIKSDLLDLKDSLTKNYDLINLTNIYEYVNNEIFTGGAQKYATTINDLITHLNNNGKMLITYLYRCCTKDIKKYRNKSIIYAKLLELLEISPLSSNYFNIHANEHGRKTIMDKLYTFRKAQLLRYLKHLNIQLYELEEVGLGCSYGAHNDMALVYTKILK